MEDLVFVDKIRRIIKMRHDDVVAAWFLVVLTIWRNISICWDKYEHISI